MESTDKAAIEKYYGRTFDESSSESSGDEAPTHSILSVSNIADSVLFISYVWIVLSFTACSEAATTRCCEYDFD